MLWRLPTARKLEKPGCSIELCSFSLSFPRAVAGEVGVSVRKSEGREASRELREGIGHSRESLAPHVPRREGLRAGEPLSLFANEGEWISKARESRGERVGAGAEREVTVAAVLSVSS